VIDLYVGAVGQVIEVSILEDGSPCDLSDATLVEMHIKLGDGVVREWEMEPDTDGSDGVFIYTTEAGDLGEIDDTELAGVAPFHVWVTTPDGTWPTDEQVVTVGEAF